MKTRFGKHIPRQRGVISIDAAVGLAMVVALLGTLAAVGVQHRRTGKALDERRVAARALEVQVGRLQTGRALDNDAVEPHDADGDWVRLSHAAAGGQVELLVYMPQRSQKETRGVEP